jgi:endoglucanase
MNYLPIFLVFFCITFSEISGYTVTGNKLYDPTGAKVILRGVDRPSFEWSLTGEMASLSDYTLMRSWGANVVRIALNQDFWLSTPSYATTIDQQIAWITQLGMGVILDLHWNNGGQQNMADRNSITFWAAVAARYKQNSWIIFELYNEPHDVTWSQWLSGDATYAGMQNLYDAVRGAGATNVVLVGGLNWAFDLTGVSAGYAVVGNNIAYATHPYDYAGKQLADWPAAFGNLAATYPVVMTEFGQYCATDSYVSDLLVYAESNGIHWSAWAWYVSGCAFPSIISDWNGTPYPGVGELVKSYMSGHAPPVSTPTPTSTTSSSTSSATSSMTVYTDALASGWQDWSWSTSYSLADTTYVHSGTKSIKFELVSYQGVYLHAATAFALGAYNQLQFYVNGGTSTKSASAASVKVYGSSGVVIGNSVNLPSAPSANQWTLISIPMSSFGVTSSTLITGFVIQSNVDVTAGFIWVDDISFVPAASSTTGSSTVAPTKAPTSAPTTAPTKAPTSAPTKAPTTAPTKAPTTAPTKAPTTAPTTAPTKAPTTAPTKAPTTTPTTAPTKAPTTAPTTAPSKAPTTAPTKAPTTAPSTPTTVPTTAPTTAPASGACDSSSIRIVQTEAGSWVSGSQTVTQYNVEVSTTCTSKKLVGLNMKATNWNPVTFWNLVANGDSLSLPSYASISPSSPLTVGYQNVGGQASFTLTSFTFQ